MTIILFITCISQVPHREMTCQMQIERDATLMFHCSTCWSGSFSKGPSTFHYRLFLLKAAPNTGGFVCQLPRAKCIIYFKISINWAYCRYQTSTNYMCRFVLNQHVCWHHHRKCAGSSSAASKTSYFFLYMLIMMWVKGWNDNKQLPDNELQCLSGFCKYMKSLISTAIPMTYSDTRPRHCTG